MNLYIDSSVMLRIVLNEPGKLTQWQEIEYGVASALSEVECLRTLDRLHVRKSLSEHQLIAARTSVFEMLGALEIVEISRSVLSRASSPFSVPLGTLDAIHLATALLFRDIRKTRIEFATHDKELALAARAVGFETLGD
jgi:predicted nucleic acid-binding protein